MPNISRIKVTTVVYEWYCVEAVECQTQVPRDFADFSSPFKRHTFDIYLQYIKYILDMLGYCVFTLYYVNLFRYVVQWDGWCLREKGIWQAYFHMAVLFTFFVTYVLIYTFLSFIFHGDILSSCEIKRLSWRND